VAAFVTFVDESERQWHVGDHLGVSLGAVTAFQADGDELVWINTHMPHLPMNHPRVARWEGWYAAAIVAYIRGGESLCGNRERV
jgi:hypothetical protein